MAPKAPVRCSYLQGAPTRNSRGRPLDTGPTVEPLVAARRNKEDDLTHTSCAVGVRVCARACLPFWGPSPFSSHSLWGQVLLLAPLFWTLEREEATLEMLLMLHQQTDGLIAKERTHMRTHEPGLDAVWLLLRRRCCCCWSCTTGALGSSLVCWCRPSNTEQCRQTGVTT